MEASQTDPRSEGGEVVRELAGAISSRLKLSSRSATLNDVFASGCWYVVLDEPAREIVFDMRALYLGFLEAGLHPQRGNIGNTARWFQDWLAGKVGEEAIVGALGRRSDMTLAGRLFASGFAPVPSVSVGDLQELARSYALRTVKRPAFDARHLFAAMIERRAIVEMTRRIFEVALTEGDIESLKRDLVDHIMRSPQRGETREIWFQTLRVRPSPSDPPSDPLAASSDAPPPEPPEDTVSPFSGDTATVHDDDVLDTEQDVEALAQLVCLEGAAPLAVAIFGDWGSGKSTFMAQLEARVRQLVRETPPGGAAADEGVARFVRPVVQIRFNAWHFADANLWASLTAEFFDQLRAGGYDRAGEVRHAKLVEEVNQHVHGLAKTASDTREALASNGAVVLQAQVAVDKAARKARNIPGSVLTKTAINLLGETYVARKRQLAALGLKPGEGGQGKAADVVVGAARDLAGGFGAMGAVVRVLFKTTGWLWIAAALGLALALAWGAGVYVQAHPMDAGWLAAARPWLAVALGVGVAVIKAIAPALAIVKDVAHRGAAILGEIDANNQAAAADLLAKDLALKKALKEAAALEEAEAASARALARYVDPKGAANPPRLLRYVLEDDPDTKALEKDIGLIGRTRRLFQAVNDIARAEHDKRRAGTAYDEQTPERIVIYIDDLDRCDETKVYEVLQAIHLLLAFDLFVVVVGVDVKWVQAALAKQFETGKPADDSAENEERRRERAMAYLEKIFQVPFWLRPLSAGAEGTFGRYVRSLAGTSVEDDAEARAKAKAAEAAEAARQAAPSPEPASTPTTAAGDPAEGLGGSQAAGQREGEAPSPVAEIRRTLQLTKAEIDFLASPEIAALAAAAPRGVKRLVNIYRLARTRRGQEDRDAVLGGKGRPAEFPMIVLMSAIETGQRHVVAEWFYDLLKSAKDQQVCDLLPAYQEAPPAGVQPGEVGALIEAGRAAAKARGDDPLLGADLLPAARLVRRYSFNRYR